MEKTFNQNRNWVYRAVSLLSFNGGFVNSITFVGFLHNPVPIGYVTGNITMAASNLTEGNLSEFMYLIYAIACFLFGSIITGIIIPQDNFKRNNKYNLVFILEVSLILLGMIGLLLNFTQTKYFLAMALGVQNALTTFYGKSIIRTTHMTGTMTDLGISIAHKLKGHTVPVWKFNIYLFLIGGFFIGSIIGIMFFKLIGYYSLIVSILICTIMLKFKTYPKNLFQEEDLEK